MGLYALALNAESYSNSFSTILRVSRTADLSVEVRNEDHSGRDPLPDYLKYATLDCRMAASAYSTIPGVEEHMERGEKSRQGVTDVPGEKARDDELQVAVSEVEFTDGVSEEQHED
jgi:hypothetical protein